MNIEKTKIAVSTVSGLIIAWFGERWELIVFAVIAILLDYLTGILAARANEGINSERAAKGLYKKVGFLSLLVLGLFLDSAFNTYIAEGLSLQIPFSLPIGLIISVWIVLTEAISVCENVHRLGVQIPRWLLDFLQLSQTKVGKAEPQGKMERPD